MSPPPADRGRRGSGFPTRCSALDRAASGAERLRAGADSGKEQLRVGGDAGVGLGDRHAELSARGRHDDVRFALSDGRELRRARRSRRAAATPPDPALPRSLQPPSARPPRRPQRRGCRGSTVDRFPCAAVGREVLGPAGIVGNRVETERVCVRRRDEFRRDPCGPDSGTPAPSMIGTLPAVPSSVSPTKATGCCSSSWFAQLEDCSGDPSVTHVSNCNGRPAAPPVRHSRRPLRPPRRAASRGWPPVRSPG